MAEEPPQKRKRKQLSACDACRLRRVRCVRSQGDDADCDGCTARGFDCSNIYVSNKKEQVAQAGRLGVAKLLYGKNDATGASLDAMHGPPLAQSFAIPGYSYSSSSSSDSEAISLSFTSPQNNLDAIQTNSFIMNALVLDYRETLLGGIPFISNYDTFLEAFERAGRRLEQLGEADQVNLTLVLALASRITDVPAIAGAGAPSPGRVKHTTDASDLVTLRVHGAQRHAVCRAFEARAVEKVSKHFLHGKPSADSIAALITLQGIVFDENKSGSIPQPRIHGAAALEQLRVALRDQPEELLRWRHMFRIALTADSLYDVDTGRSGQITDEDILLFLPRTETLTPSGVLTDAANLPSGASGLQLLDVATALLESSCLVARHMKKRLFGALARVRLGPPTFEEFVSIRADILALLQAGELLQSKAVAAEQGLLRVLRAFQMCHSFQLGILEDACKAVVRQDVMLSFLPEWTAFIDETRSLFHDNLFKLAEVAGILLSGGFLLGNALLWAPLADAAECLLSFGFEKLAMGSTQDAERCATASTSFVACMQQLAFSWPNVAGTLSSPGGTFELERLEQRLSSLKLQIAGGLPAIGLDETLSPSWTFRSEQWAERNAIEELLS